MEQIRIRTTDGREFPLTDLINYQTERGIVNIQHLNLARENRVEAQLADPKLAAQPIIQDLRENLVPQLRAQHPGVAVTFEGQARQADRFGASFMAAGLAILIGIIALISIAFRSFWQAFLVI